MAVKIARPSWKTITVVLGALIVYGVIPLLLWQSQTSREFFVQAIPSVGCFLVILYFVFPLALLARIFDIVLCELYRRKVVRQMRRLHRFIDSADLRLRTSQVPGTFILDDLTDSRVTRLWWTEDDISMLGPARPSDDEQANGVWFDHPFYTWCFDEYLDPERGRALLVAAGNGAKLKENVRRKFSNVPVLKLSRVPLFEDWYREYNGPRELVRDLQFLAAVFRDAGLVTVVDPRHGLLCNTKNGVITAEAKPEEHFRNLEVQLFFPSVNCSGSGYRLLRDLMATLERVEQSLLQAGFRRLKNPAAEELAWLEERLGGTPELQNTLAAVAEHRRQKEECVANQDFKGAHAHRETERKLINALFAQLEKPS